MRRENCEVCLTEFQIILTKLNINIQISALLKEALETARKEREKSADQS